MLPGTDVKYSWSEALCRPLLGFRCNVFLGKNPDATKLLQKQSVPARGAGTLRIGGLRELNAGPRENFFDYSPPKSFRAQTLSRDS